MAREVGLNIENLALIAALFRDKYKNPKSSVSEYVIYFAKRVSKNDKLTLGFEILDAKFAKLDNSLDLSSKTTITELSIAYDVYKNNKNVYVD